MYAVNLSPEEMLTIIGALGVAVEVYEEDAKNADAAGAGFSPVATQFRDQARSARRLGERLENLD